MSHDVLSPDVGDVTAMMRSMFRERQAREPVRMIVGLADERRDIPANTDPAQLAAGRALGGLLAEYYDALVPFARPDDEGALISALQLIAHTGFGPDAAAPTVTESPDPGERQRPTKPGIATSRSQFGSGHHIRVVNYHSTPENHADDLRRELAGYAEDFAPVTVDDLDRYFDTGTWHKDRPGLLPVFYEGYRNSATVAAPACEEVGLTGWFPIATSFIDCPVDHQEAFARSHWIELADADQQGGRIAMDWDEVRALSERHVILAHTAHHEGYDTVFDDDLEREVAKPKRLIEAATGRPCPGFVWLHGSSFGHRDSHDQAVTDAGYRYQFGNTMLHRLA